MLGAVKLDIDIPKSRRRPRGGDRELRGDGRIDKAVQVGDRFGFADLLIAAIAAEQRSPIWSLDRNFLRMAQLEFVERYSIAKD